jgi:hypothetical protein
MDEGALHLRSPFILSNFESFLSEFVAALTNSFHGLRVTLQESTKVQSMVSTRNAQ